MPKAKRTPEGLSGKRQPFEEPPGRPPISDCLLQPWFLSLEVTKAVMRLIPRIYFSRMRWFFKDYGCLRCKKKNVPYGGNCLCDQCRKQTMYRMARCMKRRLRAGKLSKPRLPEARYINRARLAESLLADLVAEGL